MAYFSLNRRQIQTPNPPRPRSTGSASLGLPALGKTLGATAAKTWGVGVGVGIGEGVGEGEGVGVGVGVGIGVPVGVGVGVGVGEGATQAFGLSILLTIPPKQRTGPTVSRQSLPPSGSHWH